MEWFVLIAVVCLILAALAVTLKSQRRGREHCPYIKNPLLFSPAERSFLGVLEQSVGDDYRVFGKVRVADIVGVKPLAKRSVWLRAFNRISAKHFDFVLCAQGDLAVVAAVELNDKSHRQRKRKERDGFLAGVCQDIGLPLVQVPAQRAYSVPELRAQILAAVGAQPGLGLEPLTPASAAPEAQVSQAEPAPPAPVDEVSAAGSGAPACPKCASPMARRQVKSGANAGREFWGCNAFPKCRGIVPVGAPRTGS